MQVLHTSAVEPTEIDALGHMNVRYYQSRALAANQALMAKLGLDPESCARRGALLINEDVYCRYHREQFVGATITVRGGVLEAGPERLRLFFELANDAKSEVAATFVIAVGLTSRTSRVRMAVPQEALDAAAPFQVGLPAHGAPRTIDLSAPRIDLGYDEVAARLQEEIADPMSRRMTRVIDAASCDEYGFLSEREDMMFGHVRSAPKPDEKWGPMTFTTDEGHRFGWASLETRNVRLEQPRVGETICSLGAEIGLHSKVRHSRRWIFNLTTGRLVSLNDNVAIALDLDARRPIEIPTKVRSELDKRHLPEFA